MNESTDFTFEFDGETLAATIDWNAAKEKPKIISLHGGSQTGKERTAYLGNALAQNGHSVLRFSFSGHQGSTGDIRQSSLKKRLHQALKATHFLDVSAPFTVIGTSMGGATAMEMTRHCDVGNVVLFCPALYAQDAFDVPFDERFTEILRRPDSFQETDLELLWKCKAGILHVIGEKDGIIPEAVTDIYENNLINAPAKEFFVIEGCGHQLHDYFIENKHVQTSIVNEIIQLIER